MKIWINSEELTVSVRIVAALAVGKNHQHWSLHRRTYWGLVMNMISRGV